MTEITTEQKIACIKREIAMRQRVYPRWVDTGKMKQEKADHEIDAMLAILRDYENVERLRDEAVPAQVRTGDADL